MAQTTFSRDEPSPVDASLEQVATEASSARKPIKCRVQPVLYDWKRTTYYAWQGVAWIVELEDVAEGRRLRQALGYLFQAFSGDAQRQKRLLQDLKAWSLEQE